MKTAILLDALRGEAQNVNVFWRSGQALHASVQVVGIADVCAACAIGYPLLKLAESA